MQKGKRALMLVANDLDSEFGGPPGEEGKSDRLTPKSQAEPKLDRATQARIGDQLRAMYNGLMEQPVPDKFKALLEKLEDPGKSESSDGEGR